MAYRRINTTDGVTVMNKDLYDNLQDGIEQFGVTPQMFGAKGDGVTDDTVAIQNALDSNKPVYFPIGLYRITSPLQIQHSNLFMYGQNAPHGHNISGVDDFQNLKKIYSCIYADFTENGTIIDIPNTVYRTAIQNILFITDKYNVSFDSTSMKATEERNEVIINGVKMIRNSSIEECAFYGFSGYGLYTESQHSRISDCLFLNCYVGFKYTKFDHRLNSLWFSRCHNAIISNSTNWQAKIEINNCWFDQIYDHCLVFDKFPYILFNGIWADLIGGCFIYTEDTLGNMSGSIIGRINRTNVLDTEKCSIYAKRIYNLILIINSSDYLTDEKQCVPLIQYIDGCDINHCVFIVPEREEVLGGNLYGKHLYVFDQKGFHIPNGDNTTSYEISGVSVRANYSEKATSNAVGNMQFDKATGKLYVCTSVNPLVWSPVVS